MHDGKHLKTRGRRTLLCAKLQKEICGYLSDCCTIRTACEATGISESSFYLWVEKGEEGRSPYKEFSEAITRARGRAKARIVHSLLDEKDWRARLELLARVFPDEYGRREPVPPPPAPPPPPPDLSRSIRVTCGGVDVGEYMRLKGELRVIESELKAIGALPDFPVVDASSTAPGEPGSSADHTIQNKSGGERPIVGDGERVVGWTDEAGGEADLP
jgi:hypothetical protein